MVYFHILKSAVIADRHRCCEIASDAVIGVVHVDDILKSSLYELAVSVHGQSQVALTVVDHVPHGVVGRLYVVRDIAKTDICAVGVAALDEEQLRLVRLAAVVRHIDVLGALCGPVTLIVVICQHDAACGGRALPLYGPFPVGGQHRGGIHGVVCHALENIFGESVFGPAVFGDADGPVGEVPVIVAAAVVRGPLAQEHIALLDAAGRHCESHLADYIPGIGYIAVIVYHAADGPARGIRESHGDAVTVGIQRVGLDHQLGRAGLALVLIARLQHIVRNGNALILIVDGDAVIAHQLEVFHVIAAVPRLRQIGARIRADQIIAGLAVVDRSAGG